MHVKPNIHRRAPLWVKLFSRWIVLHFAIDNSFLKKFHQVVPRLNCWLHCSHHSNTWAVCLYTTKTDALHASGSRSLSPDFLVESPREILVRSFKIASSYSFISRSNKLMASLKHGPLLQRSWTFGFTDALSVTASLLTQHDEGGRPLFVSRRVGGVLAGVAAGVGHL